MPQNKPNQGQGINTYLDRIIGQDGIKTSNEIKLEIDTQTAITLVGVGVGLIVFNQLLGLGIRSLFQKGLAP